MLASRDERKGLYVFSFCFTGINGISKSDLFNEEREPNNFFFDTLFTHVKASFRASSSFNPFSMFLKKAGKTVE